jgi:DNA polymerase-3 subunit epsilon
MKTLSNLQHEKSVDFAGFIALNPEGQEFFFRKNKGRLVDEV